MVFLGKTLGSQKLLFEFQETSLSFRERSHFFIISIEEEKKLVNLHREVYHKGVKDV